MSDTSDELVCPECGGPIGQTSTFCMHCSADLADRHPTRDDTGNEGSTDATSWIETETDVVDLGDARDESQTVDQRGLPAEYRSTSGVVDRSLVPDGFAIKAVTFLLAIAAGLAVGIGSMYVLSNHLAGWLAFLVGVLVLLGSTATFLRLVPG